MLGQHLVLVTLYHGFQVVLRNTTRIGHTKYHIWCNSFISKLAAFGLGQRQCGPSKTRCDALNLVIACCNSSGLPKVNIENRRRLFVLLKACVCVCFGPLMTYNSYLIPTKIA